ncbi:MAG: archaeosortase/exosortase family protein [Bacteroidota bacterium]
MSAKKKKGAKAAKSTGGGGSFQARAINFWNQKSPILIFVLGFAACMALFYALYLSAFFIENIGQPLINAQAKVGSFLLNLLGQGTVTNEEMILGNRFAISVKNGCDGLEPLAILLSGILVFPIAFRYKIPGLLLGSLALMVLNFIRIAGLYLAGLYLQEWVFDLLHEQGGFVIFTALSIFIWMFWANWAMRKNQEQAPANA